ncbi:DUF6305 family protein [Thermotoga profunda]|uniref:DUF6305 family protein n=1 Tax=Thermotoga profunda TaxID=1508420 RepID=UPI000596E8DB|nr:DUF6305 family protein [Thermotoga profunda]
MRKYLLALLILLTLSITFAQELVFQQPVLITSAGQSAGVTMMKVLATRAKLQFNFDALAKPEALTGNFKSLIIVVGASSKGLGAAGIDIEQEIQRVTELLNKAKEIGLKVIVAHIEGQSRRGKTSDQLSELVIPFADLVIVTKAGNEDNFFTNLCEKQQKKLIVVETTSAVQSILEQYFKAGE